MNFLQYRFRHIAFGLLVILTVIGCTHREEELSNLDGHTATIVLRLPVTSQVGTRATVDNTALENTIKTLRVIIAPEGAPQEGAFFLSKHFKADEIQDNRVTLSDIPVGMMRIHVIANEEALEIAYDDPEDFEANVTIDGHDHPKICVEDLDRKKFPKRLSELGKETDPDFKGLPMAWQDLEVEIKTPSSGTPQEIPVELEHSVAKLNISMTNTLKKDVRIREMSFGAFLSDKIYLFREGRLDVPEDTGYDGITYTDVDVTITSGTTETLVAYVYPSSAWKVVTSASPYAIGFKTDRTTYPLQSFVGADPDDLGTFGQPMSYMLRNTQVNIHATFKPANIQLEFKVKEWVKMESVVPPFN